MWCSFILIMRADVYTRLGISETEVARHFWQDFHRFGKDPEVAIQWLKYRLRDSSSGMNVTSPSSTTFLEGTKSVSAPAVTGTAAINEAEEPIEPDLVVQKAFHM